MDNELPYITDEVVGQSILHMVDDGLFAGTDELEEYYRFLDEPTFKFERVTAGHLRGWYRCKEVLRGLEQILAL